MVAEGTKEVCCAKLTNITKNRNLTFRVFKGSAEFANNGLRFVWTCRTLQAFMSRVVALQLKEHPSRDCTIIVFVVNLKEKYQKKLIGTGNSESLSMRVCIPMAGKLTNLMNHYAAYIQFLSLSNGNICRERARRKKGGLRLGIIYICLNWEHKLCESRALLWNARSRWTRKTPSPLTDDCQCCLEINCPCQSD